jgi:hypothetical protein
MPSRSHSWQVAPVVKDGQSSLLQRPFNAASPRSALAGHSGNDKHVDLRGDCPGEPQETEPAPGTTAPTG